MKLLERKERFMSIVLRCLVAMVFIAFSVAPDAHAQRQRSARAAEAAGPAPPAFRARAIDQRLATVRRLGRARAMSSDLQPSFTLTLRQPIVAGRGFLQSFATSADAAVGASGVFYAFSNSTFFVNLENLNHQQVLIDCTMGITGGGSVDFYIGLAGAAPAAHVTLADGMASFLSPPLDGAQIITLKPAGSVLYWSVSGCEVTPLVA
jgi:hypothetical protein